MPCLARFHLARDDAHFFANSVARLPVDDELNERLAVDLYGCLTIWAKAPLAAGERDEHLVAALQAAAPHPGEAEVQVTAADEFADHITNDGLSESVAFLVPLGIKLFELGGRTLDYAVQG